MNEHIVVVAEILTPSLDVIIVYYVLVEYYTMIQERIKETLEV